MKSQLDSLRENRYVHHRWRYGDDEAPDTHTPRPRNPWPGIICLALGLAGLVYLLSQFQ